MTVSGPRLRQLQLLSQLSPADGACPAERELTGGFTKPGFRSVRMFFSAKPSSRHIRPIEVAPFGHNLVNKAKAIWLLRLARGGAGPTKPTSPLRLWVGLRKQIGVGHERSGCCERARLGLRRSRQAAGAPTETRAADLAGV